MEITVLWSDSAIEDLQDIFNFYHDSANLNVAKRITDAIVDKTILLEKNCRLGQPEEQLSFLLKEIRYLIERHFKIVYWIEDNCVIIASVFDCRQNPVKMEGIKF